MLHYSSSFLDADTQLKIWIKGSFFHAARNIGIKCLFDGTTEWTTRSQIPERTFVRYSCETRASTTSQMVCTADCTADRDVRNSALLVLKTVLKIAVTAFIFIQCSRREDLVANCYELVLVRAGSEFRLIRPGLLGPRTLVGPARITMQIMRVFAIFLVFNDQNTGFSSQFSVCDIVVSHFPSDAMENHWLLRHLFAQKICFFRLHISVKMWENSEIAWPEPSRDVSGIFFELIRPVPILRISKSNTVHSIVCLRKEYFVTGHLPIR